jgi:hypothetical protein
VLLLLPLPELVGALADRGIKLACPGCDPDFGVRQVRHEQLEATFHDGDARPAPACYAKKRKLKLRVAEQHSRCSSSGHGRRDCRDPGGVMPLPPQGVAALLHACRSSADAVASSHHQCSVSAALHITNASVCIAVVPPMAQPCPPFGAALHRIQHICARPWRLAP